MKLSLNKSILLAIVFSSAACCSASSTSQNLRGAVVNSEATNTNNATTTTAAEDNKLVLAELSDSSEITGDVPPEIGILYEGPPEIKFEVQDSINRKNANNNDDEDKLVLAELSSSEITIGDMSPEIQEYFEFLDEEDQKFLNGTLLLDDDVTTDEPDDDDDTAGDEVGIFNSKLGKRCRFPTPSCGKGLVCSFHWVRETATVSRNPICVDKWTGAPANRMSRPNGGNCIPTGFPGLGTLHRHAAPSTTTCCTRSIFFSPNGGIRCL